MTNASRSETMMLPHSLDAEKAVLGAVIRDNNALNTVTETLRAEHFFVDRHQRIFAAMVDIASQANGVVDTVTLADRMMVLGGDVDAVGVPYLVDLMESCPVSQNIGHYAEIVRRMYFLRQIIYTTQDVQKRAMDCEGTLESFREDVERELLAISSAHDRLGLIPADKVVESAIDQIQTALERDPNVLPGCPSGFRDLDELTGGWRGGDMIILAARPGMGKTAFALNCLLNAAMKGKTSVMFTLEMPKEQLMQRLFAIHGKINSSSLRRGVLTDLELDKLAHSARVLNALGPKLAIDDQGSVTLGEVRARCRRWKQQHGLDLVVIDYLQLMGSSSTRKSDNREQQVAEISKGIKSLALELRIPIIALAQLSRAAVAKGESRPKLHHLRESGSMEQDADMVMFIHREEKDDPNSMKKGMAELIVGKNRHGPLRDVELAYLEEYVSFQNYLKTEARPASA